VDVVLEEVEEVVGDEIDSTILRHLAAKVELERTTCFVTGWKRNVLELAG